MLEPYLPVYRYECHIDVSSMERRSDASRTLISADSRWWSYYYLPT